MQSEAIPSERLLQSALCILLSFRTQINPKANVCTNSPRRTTRAPKILTSCRPHGFPGAANGTSPLGEAFFANRQKGFPPDTKGMKTNLNSEHKTLHLYSENLLFCKHFYLISLVLLSFSNSRHPNLSQKVILSHHVPVPDLHRDGHLLSELL